MNKVLSIYEIAELNSSSITSKDKFEFINYLDTSNLTRNKIESIQYLEKDYPSRAKRIVKKNTILYSTVRPNQEHFGILSDINFGNLIVSTGFTTIDVVSNQISGKYLYYKLTQPYITNYLQSIAENSVSAYPSIKPEEIGNLRFKFPELKIQQKIAKVLSDLDAKIELNNKINVELEAMAKTLYDYWFVQFDFLDKDGKPYKSSGGKMVWNEALKREIPEGWEVKELGNELSIQRGISYKSSEIKGDGVSMISLNSFNLDGTYKPEGIKKFSGKYAEKNLISEGDLLIAITDVTRNADIIGKAIIVPDYYSELVISMDIAKVIPSKKLTESYLMMLFNSNHYHNYIKWYASGTIVLHLNLDGMFWYKAEIPPKELLYEFDKIYKSISKRIAETKKQNQELASLRDWLLPMLMNGQVSVGDVEEQLSMVAEGKENYKRS